MTGTLTWQCRTTAPMERSVTPVAIATSGQPRQIITQFVTPETGDVESAERQTGVNRMYLQLKHPDLDLILIVLTVAPCIWYGIAEGIRRGMQKPREIKPALHPFRRQGDKYAYYFYIAHRYVGPQSAVYRIPKIGIIPLGVLANLALKLVVMKGEQFDYARRNTKTEMP